MMQAERPDERAWANAFPPEFDAAVYVGHPRHTDLRSLSLDQGRRHYETHGRREGRICSTIENRLHFLSLIPRDVAMLEIGPFCTPSFRRDTHDVRYLDAYSTEVLRERARKLTWADPNAVPDIDFVWDGAPYRTLTSDRFDVIVSSHNIEHQPCLVSHLNEMASLLRPGGRVFLNIPDKRYCFDHFRPESTIADVLDAYQSGRTCHSALTLLSYRLLKAHNDAEAHWRGEHGDDPRGQVIDVAHVRRIRHNLALLRKETGYIDAHAWQFTPESFRYLMTLLHAAELTVLRVERVYSTVRPHNEFHAILRVDGTLPAS